MGVALSIREVEGKQLALENITLRYYISSAELTAEKLAKVTREHWYIENKLHWKLDAAMGEDDCRVRRGDAAGILEGFLHIALNLINDMKSFQGGVKRKKNKASRNTKFLVEILARQGVS